MDPAKISGVTKWPQPKKLKDLQSFLGFCNFYHRFIQNYSHITRPLFALSKKDVPFIWTSDQESAFCALIHAFTTAPIIILPDSKLPFRLITNASDYALSAILEQSNALNRWHTVAFYSKSMIDAELNYDIHNKELLAIVKSLEHWQHYLEGHPQIFEIWIDHNNLAYFHTKQKLSQWQACWSLFLSQFNFTIIHKPGAFNKADALSRRPDHKEGMLPLEESRVLLNSKFFSVHATWPTPIDNTSIQQWIKSAQTYDSEVNNALETILHSGPRSLIKGLENWNLEEGIILYRGHIYVPKDNSLRRDIVKMYYDHPAIGHPGRWKTYELISREYWWPGLSQFTKNYIDGCATCQSTKNKPLFKYPCILTQSLPEYGNPLLWTLLLTFPNLAMPTPCVTAGSVRTRRSGELGVKDGTVRETTDSTWKMLEAPLGFESWAVGCHLLDDSRTSHWRRGK